MTSPDPSTVEWVPIWSAVTEGPVGPAGPPGAQGPPGLSTSVFYFKADATATAENDPGSGKMRWNAQPQTNATMLYFDRLTDDGFDIIALLQQTTFGTHFTIQDADLSANSQTWKQLAPGVVMGGDWFEVPVEFVSQTGSGTMQNNQRVAVLLDTMVGPHAYTHDTGGDDPITALDADVLTTGLLADARLSSNVPRLDQANVFTKPNTFDAITATVVTASGLSTTPLHASNLTTGTVPDARLSGNVQMKPVALTDLPATVATLPVAQSDVTGLVSDLATLTTGLATKAPLDSPAMTGVPTAPTASVGTATAQLATTAFVSSYLAATGYVTGPVSAVVNNLAAFNATNGARIADSAIPMTAVARQDQANIFTAVVTFQVGPTAPTAAPGTNTTQVATTAFVVSTIATSTATPAAHHASHETGGSDALAALSASILTTGTVANARLTVDVLRVTGGYPGGTTTFLRADGTFAAASGAVAAHHATHEPGGSDALVGAAWLNQANVFTVGGQEIVAAGAGPVFRLRNTVGPANSRAWHFNVDGAGVLYFVPINDDNSTAGTTYATIARTGDLTLQGNLLVTKTRPDIQVSITGYASKVHLMSPNVAPGDQAVLSYNVFFDGTSWMRDDTAKGGALLALANSGSFGFYRVAAAANPAALQPVLTADVTGSVYFSVPVTGRQIIQQPASGTPNPYYALEVRGTSAIGGGDHTAILFTSPGNGVDLKKFRIYNYAQTLRMSALNDAETAALGGEFILDRSGSVTVGNALTVAGTMTVNSATLLSGELDCVGGSGTAFSTAPIEVRTTLTPRISFHWPGVVASQIGMDSAGTIRTYDNPGTGYAAFACSAIYAPSTGNNLGDLTCGATNFTVGLNVTGGQVSTFAGPIYGAQYFYNAGVMYPGRIDNGAAQLTWYIASHGSYGLYSNTGLYLAGGLTCAAGIATAANMSVAAALSVGGTYTPIATQVMINNVSTNSSIITRCTDGGSYSSMTFLNNGNGGCGNIYVNVGGNTIYGTASDARLKTDHGRATDVSALREAVIHDFDWRRDGSRDIGLFAQEAYALFPSAILPGIDDRSEFGELVRPWMIDYSRLVPHLLVGWQHHEAEIAALKAELAQYKRTH